MDKKHKFESIVKELKGKISYEQLTDELLEEKNADLFNPENYQKYKQVILDCFEDFEFYQYLKENNCLVSAMREYYTILRDYFNMRYINTDEAHTQRKKLIEAIDKLKDEDKLKILDYREEDFDDNGYEYFYNPITSYMDKEVLKLLILSLSEEERIKFLIDKNNINVVHFERLNNDDRIEIFNSLSEKNKLRIFSEHVDIEHELGRIIFIPFLRNTGNIVGRLVKENLDIESKMEIFKNSENKYTYILQVLSNIRNFGRDEKVELIDILLDLDFELKMEILRNNTNEFDSLFNILDKYAIEDFVFDIDYIDDEVIDIVNKHLLHKDNEEIKILGDKLKAFANIDERILSVYRYELIDYLQNESDENIQFLGESLKRLKNINEDILSTCKFKMLTTKYKDLSTKLDFITCDVEVQEKILSLNDNQYNVLKKVLDIIEKDNIKDWIPIVDNLLNGLNNKKYKSLLESIDAIELTDDETIKKLVYILSNSENIFNIQNIEEVKKFNRLDYIEKIKQGELRTEYTRHLSKIEKLQLCILEKKYGQSLEESKRLLLRYGKDLDEFELDNESDIKVKSYLESIRNILNTVNVKKLEEIYTSKENLQENYLFNNIIESQIREYFCRQYNKVLYKLQEKNKLDIQMPLCDGIEIYDSGEDFIIELTSLGAYSKYDVSKNFNEEWNRKLIKSHGFCTSTIANNNIATAKIKYLALGFNDFSENSLLLSAPWDIMSTKNNLQMNTSKGNDRILYNIPKKQIDNIRHTHSENVRERRALAKAKIYKKQPSYIVYIPEIPLEKYLELKKQGKMDNRFERNRLLIEHAQDDTIWQNCVKASNEFLSETEDRSLKPLPILIVDRTYIAIKEKEKLDKLEEEFKNTGSPNLIKRIIIDSENNRTGNLFCEEIRENLFSSQILQERIYRIENIIKELEEKDNEIAKKCKEMLIEATIEEEQKYKCFGIIDVPLKEKPGYNHDEYIKRWIEEFNKPVDIVKFRKECLGENGKQEIVKTICEIEKMQEYPDRGIHSKRHIENVALFSYMIANKEGKLNEECKRLLLETAKYHDSGRSSLYHNGRRVDGKEEHARCSTYVAKEYMKKQGIEPNKIAMVQVAILYHEHKEKEKNQFDEKEFLRMCEAFGVTEEDMENTRLMCQYLKDADALDRTRFNNEAGLNPRFLRTDTAKSLIGEAKRIDEKYKELDSKGERKSVIHIIDEEELEENNDKVSEEERRKAAQILNEVIKNISETEVSDNGK